MSQKQFSYSLITISTVFALQAGLHSAYAKSTIDVNIDVKHQVGGESTFDREKFMVIHSANIEPDWIGESEKKDYLLNQLDTYFARETGSMKYQVNQIEEDPARTGYAHPSGMITAGAQAINNYKNTLDSKNLRSFEHRAMGMVTAAQDVPFYPGSGVTQKGWTFTSMVPFGHSTGEFMGRFLRDYFGSGGDTGRPMPKFIELMNEPVWPLVDMGYHGGGSINDIFTYHLSAANEIKKFVPDAKVGGFTTAFPELEKNDFQQWDERWKYFIDLAGDKMDFYSFHLYDLPAFEGGEHYRSGANIEATLDMLEGYSRKEGKERPFLISEYGAQVHTLKGTPYNPYRDWLNVAAFNSMLMQFLERPDRILKAIPFGPIKAEWGRTAENIPYTSRMMRQTGEPESATGDWVWTDYIKFYELWSPVRGTRVDTKQSNINIQTDAYASDDKLYVIFNNLSKSSEEINLNLFGNSGLSIVSVKGNHLYLDGNNKPALVSITPTKSLSSEVTLNPEATMVLEYTFDSDVPISHVSEESKYYATKFKQPISANTNHTFTIEGVTTAAHGEAVLRIGIGRDLDLSRTPTIIVNNTTLNSTPLYRGSNQQDKSSFFGLLEVPVPYNLIKETNTIQIRFPDNSGHISSVALQHFSFTKSIPRSFAGLDENIVIEAESFSNTGSTTGIDGGGYDGVNATNNGINWVNGRDWVSYQNIDVPVSGYYTVNYHIATPNSDRTITFFVDGEYKLATAVPNTGDWSNYTQVESANVFLTKGPHNFMLSSGDQEFQWNLDKFELINQTVLIDAADFSNTGSMTGTDQGGFDGVSATANGIEWVNGQDWVSYQNIQILKSGNYKVNYKIASPYSDRVIKFFVNGEHKTTSTVPNTGNWQTYESALSDTVYIPSGVHNIMLSAGTGELQWNLNSFELVRQP